MIQAARSVQNAYLLRLRLAIDDNGADLLITFDHWMSDMLMVSLRYLTKLLVEFNDHYHSPFNLIVAANDIRMGINIKIDKAIMLLLLFFCPFLLL